MIDPAIIAWALAYASWASGLAIPPDAPPPQVAIAANLDGYLYLGTTSIIDGRISLWAGWQPNSAGRCLLVHELVHYIQFLTVGVRSSAYNEPVAYRAEASCYNSNGLPEQALIAKKHADHYKLGQMPNYKEIE